MPAVLDVSGHADAGRMPAVLYPSGHADAGRMPAVLYLSGFVGERGLPVRIPLQSEAQMRAGCPRSSTGLLDADHEFLDPGSQQKKDERGA